VVGAHRLAYYISVGWAIKCIHEGNVPKEVVSGLVDGHAQLLRVLAMFPPMVVNCVECQLLPQLSCVLLACASLDAALQHADRAIDNCIGARAIEKRGTQMWAYHEKNLLAHCLLYLPRAKVLAATAVRDNDEAKLKAAEEEIENIRSQMLGWGCDSYTEAVIAKELQVICKATGRKAEGRARLEEAASKLEIKEESGFKDWLLGDRII